MKIYRPVFTRAVIIIDVVGNILLLLFFASPHLIWAWIAFGSESTFIWRFTSFIPLVAIGVYGSSWLIRMQWNMWMRRERWTTYFQTRNTLAIKIPRQPIKFVHRRECLAFVPCGDCLMLRDGAKYKLPGVPAGEERELSRGEEIIASWWPEIDIERIRRRRKRKLPEREWVVVAVVGVVFLHTILHSALRHKLNLESSEMDTLAVNVWLIPPVYVLAWLMLRRYDDFNYPLPREQGDPEVDLGSVGSKA